MPTETDPAQPPRKITWTRRILRLLTGTVLIPALVIGGLEGGLRAAGYGTQLRPFTTMDYGGERYHLRNRAFIDQFLGWADGQGAWDIGTHEVPERKPDGAVRIFVLGGSAAEGWPAPEFAFSRLLEAMLNIQFPETRFEVHNFAFMAMNSHVMRAIANACASLEPDFFLVYMGNNEFYGPFGPVEGKVSTRVVPSLATIRARIWLGDVRLFQLLQPARGAVGRSSEGNEHQLFQTADLRPDDPVVERVHAHFAANLHAITEAAHGGGAQILFSTVGANLHWPPTNPTHRRDLSETERAEWEEAYQRGMALQAEGRHREALEAYAKALVIDDTHAELHFRCGKCHLQVGEAKEARHHFLQALQWDTFEWVRAKPPINDIIMRIALARTGQGVRLVDAVGALAAAAPEGIPGFGLFPDACHPNLDGAYVIAAAFYEQLLPLLPAAVRAQAADLSVPAKDHCARVLCLTPEKQREMLRPMMSGSIEKDLLQVFEVQMARLAREPATSPEAFIAMLRAGLEVMERDYLLRFQLVNRLLETGNTAAAVPQAQTLVTQYPCNNRARQLLCRALQGAQHYEEAVAACQEMLALFPEESQNHVVTATVYRAAGQHEQALAHCRIAFSLEPANALAKLTEAEVLLEQGQPEASGEALVTAVEHGPHFAVAYEALDEYYRSQGAREPRIAQWRIMAERHPDIVHPHRFLADALADAGQFAAAAQAYRRALEIDPAAPGLHTRLAAALAATGDHKAAEEHYREALAHNPQDTAAREQLEALLAVSPARE